MSIPAEDWQALTTLAEQVGTTRTDLIRMFIRSGVAGDSSTTEVQLQATEYELQRAREQLDALLRQLDTIRQPMEAIAVAARLAEDVVRPTVAA